MVNYTYSTFKHKISEMSLIEKQKTLVDLQNRLLVANVKTNMDRQKGMDDPRVLRKLIAILKTDMNISGYHVDNRNRK